MDLKFSKIKDIQKSIDDFVQLESVMIPILQKVNISISPNDIKSSYLNSLEDSLLYINDSKLVALLRFQKQEEKVFIKSLIISETNKEPLYAFILLKRAQKTFKSRGLSAIESVVQKSNKQSLKLHKRLGFEPLSETSQSIKFTLNIKR